MAKKTGKQKTTKKASTPNKQTAGKQKQKAKLRFRGAMTRIASADTRMSAGRQIVSTRPKNGSWHET
jgi:hypothetical protein